MHTMRLIEAAASVRVAVKYFALSVETVLNRRGLKSSDVDLYSPHQANIRMLQSLVKRLDVDFEEKFFITIEKCLFVVMSRLGVVPMSCCSDPHGRVEAGGNHGRRRASGPWPGVATALAASGAVCGHR
ncbi:hypothetical protein DFAR_3690015 [Desulfarculales bacterium]